MKILNFVLCSMYFFYTFNLQFTSQLKFENTYTKAFSFNEPAGNNLLHFHS